MANQDWQTRKILIVEDDLSSLKLLNAYLGNTKAAIFHVQNGKEAVAFCREHDDIDLILMDIQLPEMDGITATQIIKRFRKDLPVIAETAHALLEERNFILSSGCDDYIAKPINKQDLFDVMGKYI